MDTQHKAQPDPVPTSLTFRLSDDEHAALRTIAERHHRSMTGQIRAWIAAERTPEPEREAA